MSNSIAKSFQPKVFAVICVVRFNFKYEHLLMRSLSCYTVFDTDVEIPGQQNIGSRNSFSSDGIIIYLI